MLLLLSIIIVVLLVMYMHKIHNYMEYNTSDVQLFCHPKYSILYGVLMIFVVGSGQE